MNEYKISLLLLRKRENMERMQSMAKNVYKIHVEKCFVDSIFMNWTKLCGC